MGLAQTVAHPSISPSANRSHTISGTDRRLVVLSHVMPSDAARRLDLLGSSGHRDTSTDDSA
jgi:hypothetical protein